MRLGLQSNLSIVGPKLWHLVRACLGGKGCTSASCCTGMEMASAWT